MTKRSDQIGARLAKVRQLRGMSQRALAEKAGFSYAFVSRIEVGARRPSIRAIRRFASALDVSPHYLETGDEHGFWVYVTRDEVQRAAEDGCVLCAVHVAENQFVAA